ncbi:Hypothetical protein R9X50_00227500 [Acrodontium crateriforme]|uniref:Peptidase A1 domain-containing protein n=1 Tax=Acrodontium crateriforme TaxID=150365 RepID=A0AAQ3M6N1_9PEZI|nr:Hypothetical protein R9X50_00227500 [Acrodontium crateriforme]
MPSFMTSAALVAGATLSMAAPTERTPKTFRLNQVSAGKYHKSGPIALLNTYNRYSKHIGPAPAHVVKAAQDAQEGSVAANPQAEDEAYVCPVTAGSSQLNLDFDTGSADLWVFATDTPSSESQGHNLYDTSSGQQIDGATWDITYQDQSGSKGVVFSDTVVVGGVTATSQAVEAATSVSTQFVQNTGSDGLLGLAFSSINTVQPQQQTTFFDTVADSLAAKLFTADLKKGEAGSYDFGYIDDSKHTGDITYVDVDNSQGFWGFTAGGYSVGDDTSAGGDSIGSAIADTGTTLLYVPSSVASAYYQNVDGAENDSSQGGYVFPCSNTLPDFHVAIGSGVFTVPGSYINYAPTDSSGSTCFGGLQGGDGQSLSIFGDIFLKAHFVVFDQTQDSPRLGFAPQ